MLSGKNHLKLNLSPFSYNYRFAKGHYYLLLGPDNYTIFKYNKENAPALLAQIKEQHYSRIADLTYQMSRLKQIKEIENAKR